MKFFGSFAGDSRKLYRGFIATTVRSRQSQSGPESPLATSTGKINTDFISESMNPPENPTQPIPAGICEEDRFSNQSDGDRDYGVADGISLIPFCVEYSRGRYPGDELMATV